MSRKLLAFRKCYMCGEYKPRDQFSDENRRHEGVSSRCRECKLIYDRERTRERKSYFAEYRKLHPDKRNAKDMVFQACKNGLITKGRCEVCGNEKVIGHHDDYSKPLDVRWLCRKHHGECHFGHGGGESQKGRLSGLHEQRLR